MEKVYKFLCVSLLIFASCSAKKDKANISLILSNSSALSSSAFDDGTDPNDMCFFINISGPELTRFVFNVNLSGGEPSNGLVPFSVGFFVTPRC